MRDLALALFALALFLAAFAYTRSTINANALRQYDSVASKSAGGGTLISPADVVACRFHFEDGR